MKTYLLLILCLTSALCMYEHQQGQFDWNIKTIGQYKDILITQDNIFFQSTDNLFGNIKSKTGIVNMSYGRNDIDQNLLWNKNIQAQKNTRYAIVSKTESLQIYDFIKNQYIDSINAQLDSEILDYIYLKSGKIVILTENSVSVTFSENDELFLKEVVIVSNNEKFVGLAQIKDKIQVISQNSQSLCIYEFSQNEISKIDTTTNASERKCFELSTPFDKKALGISSSFIFHKGFVPLIVDIETKTVVELSSYQNHIFEYDLSQGLIVSRIADEFNFYKVNNGSLSKLHSFNNSNMSQILYAKIDEPTLDFNTFYYIENQTTGFAVLKKVVSGKETDIYKWAQSTAIQNVWIKFINQKNILVQNFDLQTVLYTVENGLIWTREESLSNIKDLKFIDYTHANERTVSAYHEMLDERGSFNTLFLIPQFILRVTGEFQEMVIGFFNSIGYFQQVLSALLQSRSLEDLKAINNIGGTNLGYNIFYGLKKLIIIITEQHTIFRYESDNGDLVWRSNASNLVNNFYELVGFYDLEERKEELIHNELIAVYYSQRFAQLKIIQINPVNGELTELQALEMKQKPLQILKIQKEFNNYLLILDSEYKGYTYPAFQGDLLSEHSDHLIFYKYNQEANNIEGYKFYGNKVEQIWNVNFSSKEEIIQIDSSYSEDQSPRVALFDDKKVIFKHIDYTNFAIITKNKGKGVYQGQGILNLYIINSKTGRVLFNHNQQLVDLSLPINMVYDENAVFVSYFNPEQFLYEIWVVEAYSKDMVTSFIDIIEDYYISPKHQDDTFNYVEEDMNIIFLEQKYGFPKGIKALSVVETKLALTKRNLVIITQQNQIYSLNRHLVSTRRSIKSKIPSDMGKTLTFDSADLPPYQYLLPIDFKNTLSYFLNLNGLDKVEFAPTNFESTSLFIAYGGDIFCSKISPEKTFDILSEDFNYVSLVLTMGLVCVMVVIMRKFAKNSLIFKIFHK